MTREEAKRIIQDSIPEGCDCPVTFKEEVSERCADCEFYIALQTAIKALEQEPCDDDKPCTECPKYDKEKHYCPHFCHVIRGVFEDKEPCDDAVSREDAIIQISWDFPNLELPKIKESLDKLPPVQPKRQTDAEWIDWLCRMRSEINSGMDMATIPKNHRDKFIDVLTEVIDVLGADMRGDTE